VTRFRGYLITQRSTVYGIGVTPTFLIARGGTSGRGSPERQIAKAILEHDQSQIEYDEIVRDMVGWIVRSRYFVGRAAISASLFFQLISLSAVAQAIPENAHVSGNIWYCDTGYKRVGNTCQKLNVPENARVSGNVWYCDTGYKRVGNTCQKLNVPEDAHVSGNVWYCDTGYKRVGNTCRKLNVPENAHISGNVWYCDTGYKRVRETCTEMTEQDKARQRLMLLTLETSSGEGCDAAYHRCVNECEDVSVLFDYERDDYHPIGNSDFASNCEDACQGGRNHCEDEEGDERCFEFKRACTIDCPTSVFDYDESDYLLLTDAEDTCEDACSAGKRACE
jgi:enoyl-[acyl-carrier-protein] reductase (NADH)